MLDSCSHSLGDKGWSVGIRPFGPSGTKDARFYFTLRTDRAAKATTVYGQRRYRAGVWTHLAATYDGLRMSLYADGAKVGHPRGLRGSGGAEPTVLLLTHPPARPPTMPGPGPAASAQRCLRSSLLLSAPLSLPSSFLSPLLPAFPFSPSLPSPLRSARPRLSSCRGPVSLSSRGLMVLLVHPGGGEQPADREPLQSLHEDLQEPVSGQQPAGPGPQLQGPRRGAAPVELRPLPQGAAERAPPRPPQGPGPGHVGRLPERESSIFLWIPICRISKGLLVPAFEVEQIWTPNTVGPQPAVVGTPVPEAVLVSPFLPPPCGLTPCDNTDIISGYNTNWQLRAHKRVRYRVVNLSEDDGGNPTVSGAQVELQHRALNRAFRPYNITFDLEVHDEKNTSLRQQFILSNCQVEKIGNRRCDPECDHPRTGHDGGDCLRQGPCYAWKRQDGVCNAECNSIQYDYDDGDCCDPEVTDVVKTCFDPESPDR